MNKRNIYKILLIPVSASAIFFYNYAPETTNSFLTKLTQNKINSNSNSSEPIENVDSNVSIPNNDEISTPVSDDIVSSNDTASTQNNPSSENISEPCTNSSSIDNTSVTANTNARNIITYNNNGIPNISGKIIYHTYSSYEARDSKIYILDLDTKTKTCISDNFSNIINPMNAVFNPNGKEIAFMGLTNDQWDIYTYNLEDNTLKNLTGHLNLRNEDPKYSSDGKKIVFKQGAWSTSLNDMVYNIKEIDLSTNEVTSITNDDFESSMPCYSQENDTIYYAQGKDSSSKIYSINKDAKKELLDSSNLRSYYPISSKNYLYFTRAYSNSNDIDTIVRLNYKTNEIEILPFNSENYNSSDPYPINDEFIIISSTKQNGKGGYDLYIASTKTGDMWPLDSYIDNVNDSNHQLGASYFS